MSSTLALRPAAPQHMLAKTLGELPFGAQSQVCVASGKVAAFLAYARYDARVCVATYALRILNDSALPVRARIYCITREGERVSGYPLQYEIAPYSLRDDYVPIRLDATGPFDRALVEVSSDETYFTVEAPAPPAPRRQWLPWCSAAILPIVLTAAAVLSMPRVAALSAPERAYAGAGIAVPFETSGFGNVEYTFTRRDGVQLTAGLAAAHAGVLRLTLPAQLAGSPYTLRVRVRSPFASAEQSATIAAIQVPKPLSRGFGDDAPLIDELSIAPSPVRAGETLAVSYATHAERGDVFLVDLSGRTWAAVPLSLSGTTYLPIPQAASGRTMRIVLHAVRGKQQAQSSVEALMLPSQQVQRAPTPPAPVATPSPMLTLSTPVASAGDTVDMHVSGMHGDVRVTVMNAQGATIAQADGSAGAVSITAPMVNAVTSYYVIAAFSDGVAQQSIVKRLVVTPR